MSNKKKLFTLLVMSSMVLSLSACKNETAQTTPVTPTTTQSPGTEDTSNSAGDSGYTSSYVQNNDALTFDTAKWNYDATNNVYWRIGVQYSSAPEALDYETMGIYIPGEYMNGTLNSDGTYTCTINEAGKLKGYTAATAPIILPIDTPGYMAQAAPTSYDYDSISSYMDAGFVYVVGGMRGRGNIMGSSDEQSYSGGAPWGITDLKAAVRYYRFNADLLPGDTDSIFSYGMSGGGAQSALIGATGDNTLYYPYLETIGAAMTTADGEKISDAITGSMDWCPITNLDYADEAYEWNMGQYFSTDTRDGATFTSALSDDMAEAFAKYINELGLEGEDGTKLTLAESQTGIYNSGTYYDYILNEIETSLNNFLSDTTFPYKKTSTQIQIGNTAGSGGQPGADLAAGDKTGQAGGPGQGKPDLGKGGPGEGKPDLGKGGFGKGSEGETVTYATVQDYIDSLNADGKWITYDANTNTAQITSIEDFVTHSKNATKSVGAFDSVDLSQGENNVFGNGQNTSNHFDTIEAALLEKNKDNYATFADWKAEYITDFTTDLAKTDSLGTTTEVRANMYNPMYYVSDYYDGYGTSTVAKYWRIRTGINQTDTALTVEENLKLALESNENVESVDFATVWGQPHTTAERTGTSTDNFIAWVNECLNP